MTCRGISFQLTLPSVNVAEKDLARKFGREADDLTTAALFCDGLKFGDDGDKEATVDQASLAIERNKLAR